MINQMTINGIKAVISYDSDIDLFRGEFIGLNGGGLTFMQVMLRA
ncbi:MAG: hypothetical protein NT008_07080 [Methylococcales bacterium]|nr:hypothetical protein [Methylococcales bacterium]